MAGFEALWDLEHVEDRAEDVEGSSEGPGEGQEICDEARISQELNVEERKAREETTEDEDGASEDSEAGPFEGWDQEDDETEEAD